MAFDLDNLRVFLAAIDHGSFSTAEGTRFSTRAAAENEPWSMAARKTRKLSRSNAIYQFY